MRGWAGWLLTACVCMSFNAMRIQAAEPEGGARQAELEALLSEAIDEFGTGRFVAARAKLEKLLELNPVNEEAWRLREAFGDKILREMAMWMNQGRTLGTAPEELLTRALSFDASKRDDPESIRQVVEDAVRDGSRNLKMLYELSVLGAQAAPWLVDQLRNERDQTLRANAGFLLTQLGPSLTVPLSQALSGLLDQPDWSGDETALAQLLSDALGGIRPGDPRALPVLKRFMEDERRVPAAREWAARAATKVAGVDASLLPSASDLLHAEALRLYVGGPRVDNEMFLLRGRYYVWDPKYVSPSGRPGFLRSVQLPSFALDDLYAQDMIFAGMNLPGGVEYFVPLLARAWVQQAIEVDEYASTLGQQGLIHPELARHEADVAAWRQRLEANRRNAYLVGPERLSEALTAALVEGKAQVALGLLDGLAATARWDLLEDRQPLLDALGYSDFRVRHKAAATLVEVGIPAGHERLPDVTMALCDGATVKTQKVVVLMMANAEARMEVRKRLESRGISVLATDDGVEGLSMVWAAPFKDAVLVDAELEVFVRLHRRLLDASLAPGMILPESGLPPGKMLPVVVVTTEERAKVMELALPNDSGWHVTREVVTDPEASLLFRNVVSRHVDDVSSSQRVLVLATNNDGEARRKIQQRLLLEAEKFVKPSTPTELLRAMEVVAEAGKKGLAGLSSPDLRSLYVNVFLDEDLSSSSAMDVLLSLRRNPRSAVIPVAVLSSVSGMSAVEKDFKEYLNKGPLFRVLSAQASEDELLMAVDAMSAANELVVRDFQKEYFQRAAWESARALGSVPRGLDKLPEDRIPVLREALLDTARSVGVRSALARAFGWWEESSLSGALSTVFTSTNTGPEDHQISLRQACMWALGRTDRAGTEREVKEQALSNRWPVIRDIASTALAMEMLPSDDILGLLDRQHHNAPLRLLGMGETIVPLELTESDESSSEEGGVESSESEEEEEESTESTDEVEEEEESSDDAW